ncbi:MAG: acyl carrier protein [Candidatus Peribacteraceae bacterium]|jgi:hypothetical protein|nr:hypothetical protein [bacterium]MDP6561683.1 acyl carrier protein [Candidatus Peribacteraceae bacterium]|tara:strand:- start:48447 stop:48770 length:324 start_codon:yes stop_codon:yes gene_type:complete
MNNTQPDSAAILDVIVTIASDEYCAEPEDLTPDSSIEDAGVDDPMWRLDFAHRIARRFNFDSGIKINLSEGMTLAQVASRVHELLTGNKSTLPTEIASTDHTLPQKG